MVMHLVTMTILTQDIGIITVTLPEEIRGELKDLDMTFMKKDKQQIQLEQLVIGVWVVEGLKDGCLPRRVPDIHTHIF